MPLIGVVTPLFPRPDDIYSGQAIYQSVRALRRHADVAVLCPQAVYGPRLRPPAQWDVEKPWDGLQVTDVPYSAVPLLSRPFNGASCARAISPALEALKCDITLAYWVYPEGYAAIEASHRIKTPAVVFSRGSDLRRIPDPMIRRRVRKSLSNADYVLTVSEELRSRAISLGAVAERSRTILNGCNHDLFRYVERAGVRAELGVAADAEVVLYVGRLVAAKGITDLIEAFAERAGEFPRRRLVFVGNGPLRKQIHVLSRQFGFSQRLQVVDPLPPAGIARWMQAADVLCLPSYSEGCPNVVIEAIASGCPVIATDVGGVPEILPPECGITIRPHDPAGLAQALDAALSRAWDRARISRSYGRSWDDVARETYDVCRDVLHPPRRMRTNAARAGRGIKITVVTPYFPRAANSYTGHSAEHTLRKLTAHAEVSVICPVASPPSLRGHADIDYQPPGLPTTYFRFPIVPFLTRPFNGRGCEQRLLAHLQRERPDVVLNYWLYPEGLAAVRAAHKLGIPAIVGSIGSDLRRIPDPATRRLVRQTVREADGIITVSEDLRRIAIGLGAAPEHVTTILNGCDTSLFYPASRRSARAAVAAADEEDVVLFVGSLFKAKGLAELMQAFIELVRRRPNARLVCIGAGPYRQEIVKKATAGNIQGRVAMLGLRPSAIVADWMRAADVLCLPSYSEGCPNAIVEALASGLPVVATDVGGIPELVDEQSGILVPPYQPAALSAALTAALSRDWDHQEIAAKFRRTWEAVAEDTLDVCLSVLERAAPKRFPEALAAGGTVR